jgi:hypothetical protein
VDDDADADGDHLAVAAIGSMPARRGLRGSAVWSVVVVRCGNGDRRKTVGLVLYLHGHLPQFRFELAGVVRTEQQFAAAGKDNPKVCLGAAPITTVGGRQRTGGCQNRIHVASSLLDEAFIDLQHQISLERSRGDRVTFNSFSTHPFCNSFLVHRTCPVSVWFMPATRSGGRRFVRMPASMRRRAVAGVSSCPGSLALRRDASDHRTSMSGA